MFKGRLISRLVASRGAWGCSLPSPGHCIPTRHEGCSFSGRKSDSVPRGLELGISLDVPLPVWRGAEGVSSARMRLCAIFVAAIRMSGPLLMLSGARCGGRAGCGRSCILVRTQSIESS